MASFTHDYERTAFFNCNRIGKVSYCVFIMCVINSARPLFYVYVNVYEEGGVGPRTRDALVNHHKILLKLADLSHIIIVPQG